MNGKQMKTPYYLVYEKDLRRNLNLIKNVADTAGIEIIMAFKANALWKTFPVIKEYISSSTASSLNEMRLSNEFLGGEVHAYCPVYTKESFPGFMEGCSHITFNSLSQFEKFYPEVKKHNEANQKKISCGLRINPRVSVVDTGIYDPSLPGSRFGVNAENIPDSLPEGLDGFHFHALCESSLDDLIKVWDAIETKFGKWLPELKWINMGGGHLMTRKGYNIIDLIEFLKEIKLKYPHLKIIMEPGSAFTWETGVLVAKVLDVVEDSGIKTAIIDASFACHMPDCLEMPYKPKIKEALPDESEKGHEYRIGGNTCLSGDFCGTWKFDRPLKEGDILTFLDMNHYTNVKTNMFNGVQHPAVWFQPSEGEPMLLREYIYDDYKNRMD